MQQLHSSTLRKWIKKHNYSLVYSRGFLFAKSRETPYNQRNYPLPMNPLELPKLTKHVTDFSWVLSHAQIESFSETLAAHECTTSEEVVVVLFPHREWHELLDIGMQIFNDNGIGQKNLNNWILLVIATEEKKIRIITGKWMELKYTEMRCRHIIENRLRPLLDNENYEELLSVWIEEVSLSEIDGLARANTMSECVIDQNEKWYSIVGGVGGIFSMFMINGYISWTIGILLWAWLYLLLRYNKNKWNIRPHVYPYTLIGPILIILVSIIAFLAPANCTITNTWSDGKKEYSCERNVFGYEYHYNMSTGGSSSSSSSNNHHGESSSSSFGGGGGSSNGGGYGD